MLALAAYSPQSHQHTAGSDSTPPPLFDNLGNYQQKIKSSSPGPPGSSKPTADLKAIPGKCQLNPQLVLGKPFEIGASARAPAEGLRESVT